MSSRSGGEGEEKDDMAYSFCPRCDGTIIVANSAGDRTPSTRCNHRTAGTTRSTESTKHYKLYIYFKIKISIFSILFHCNAVFN